MMTINTICVCGAGTMGSGIAQTAAQSGFFTLLYELNPQVLEKAMDSIRLNLGKLTAKGKISNSQEQDIFRRIKFTSDLHECLADVFIEAIVEKMESKVSLFNQLAELNHSESVFATNTSSLSVGELAKKIVNPNRVIGMHFFNPATIMKLVEVVVTDQTSSSTRDTVIELAGKMGKTPVVCRDSPGFIVNRVARPFYIEALRLAEEGINDLSQVDEVMESAGFKMGPFRLMDLIGNDVNYAVSCSVYEQLGGPPRLQPSVIQEQKVKSGKLGRKTGEGYYSY
jgi:3-hydroxybutyryl-CoA dehydrogenase